MVSGPSSLSSPVLAGSGSATTKMISDSASSEMSSPLQVAVGLACGPLPFTPKSAVLPGSPGPSASRTSALPDLMINLCPPEPKRWKSIDDNKVDGGRQKLGSQAISVVSQIDAKRGALLIDIFLDVGKDEKKQER